MGRAANCSRRSCCCEMVSDVMEESELAATAPGCSSCCCDCRLKLLLGRARMAGAAPAPAAAAAPAGWVAELSEQSWSLGFEAGMDVQDSCRGKEDARWSACGWWAIACCQLERPVRAPGTLKG